MRARAGALVLAALVASCGGPAGPTPPPGGGGNGGQQPTPNTPPQVKSVTVAQSRVEVGTPVTVTAVVEDAETPVANLTYTWTSTTGSFTGTGAEVTWTAGQDAKTPEDYVLTLTVTERFTTGSINRENTATGTVTVHVNNSPKELADLSLRFLNAFADSKVSPETCVAEFTESCSGKKDELQDVIDNRHDFEITASSLRHTGLQIDPARSFATVHTACSFTSRVITATPQSGGCLNVPGSCRLGAVQQSSGDCWTTNVYEKGRWWICQSHFTPDDVLSAFERAFFGISGSGSQ
jgi:hypothetical protein